MPKCQYSPDWFMGLTQAQWKFQPGNRNWEADFKTDVGIAGSWNN